VRVLSSLNAGLHLVRRSESEQLALFVDEDRCALPKLLLAIG
jgi:hypothetical protein